MNPLCKYRHILGKEQDGFHKTRFFGVALFDTLATIVGAWLISKALKVNFLVTLIGLFVVGIILHRMFCVNTTINKMIFGKV
jgi:hypothetical protein